MTTSRSQKRRSGFTLLEVLLVLLIIGLLVGMVAPYMFGIKERANVDAARGQVGLLHDACDYFRLHMNDYPSNMEQLIVNPGTSNRWSGPYLNDNKLPKDPWGHEYIYEYQAGGKPLIYSMGPDGQPNTADDVHKDEAQ